MKNFKLVSIIFLIICLSVSVFTACKNDYANETTTSSASSESTNKTQEAATTGTTVYYDENYTYHSIVYKTEKATDAKGDEYTYAVMPTTEFVPITIVTTPKTTRIETTSQSVKVTEAEKTTQPASRNPIISTEPIKEISKGIGVLTKTTPVMAGNSATITVLGNPNETYTIEFYEEGSTPSVASGLEAKKSNNAGFVSWTFSVSPLCSAGEKKIIIKEKGSQNYIQTSITIK